MSLAEIPDALIRRRPPIQSLSGVSVVVDQQPALNFCSNDYLGLAQHPEVVRAFKQAVDRVGVGAGSAVFVSGYHYFLQELEEALAEFLHRPRVLVFNSGYQQNVGILATLVGRHDTVFSDKLIHASLVDGIRLSGAKHRRYPHRDYTVLERQLMAVNTSQKLIVSDSVFSMDGDVADIGCLSELAQQHDATLLIDDAHGFGINGVNGRGVIDDFPKAELPWVMATLSKAVGVAGGFVSAGVDAIEQLIQQTRSYRYTTAMPPAMAAAATTALKIIAAEPWRRTFLADLIAYFRHGAQQLNLPILASLSPIQPILFGSAERAVRVSALLLEKGYYVSAMRPPTVPKNQSRLRITLTAQHTRAQVNGLLGSLAQVLQNA